MEYAWEWKEEYGGIILEQLRRLGASCDWSRTRFTMEEDLYDAVIEVFVDLYEKGYIYRGERMINWDPQAQTALSDEEVEYKEVKGKLYHVNYKIEGEEDYVKIATTRPETILGDTAVCVNPEDERYQHLEGKRVIVPLVDRSVPVIFDEFVDMEFGTGCLKITPAHDEADYEIGQRHELETINIFNADGTLNEKAQLFVGVDRMEGRRKVAEALEDAGVLAKVEDYPHKVGFSERTDVPIEPRLSLQWFCRMDDLAAPALEAVMSDDIQFHPPKFKNTYQHWMENIRDWCISRQLWWGQRIPAYYINEEKYVVARNKTAAVKKAREKFDDPDITESDLRQDEDVVDTWFSSWLWPISVFDGFQDPDNADISAFYPTDVLVTGPDIIFFWVARMIMAGYEFRDEKPFDHVYFTGMVRDEKGRKMSKSLGNSPDLNRLLDEYGADGVRTGVLFSSSAGNDLLFEEKLCEQGRNFGNKIWNALRLVKGWKPDDNKEAKKAQRLAIEWFQHRRDEVITTIDDHFEKFRISDALMTVYRFIWEDFCSWYLEMIKPGEDRIDENTYEVTITFFEQLLRLLHPFMPFVTEEIWQRLRQRSEGESIMVADWPQVQQSPDSEWLKEMEDVKAVISQLRHIRNKEQVPSQEGLEVKFISDVPEKYKKYKPVIQRLEHIESLSTTQRKIQQAKSFRIGNDEFFVVLDIDTEKERKKLKEELEYNRGFLEKVEKKLDNEGFLNNAPEHVVEKEKKKKADAEKKIAMLKKSLQQLNGDTD